ncbi:MAG TPA: 16S rRNA (cytidine(1402)-2'-O)-methyltransferase [Actinomycetota bacterium]
MTRPPGTGTLFVVGTPIGNLGDATERSREVLGSVDVIAAEDTRRTGSLLARLGVERPRFVSLFEGNERERTVELVGELRAGRSVALVSDAGMPTVSDPGYRLVKAAGEAGVDVRVVPGPSAVVAALAVSGLPTDRFAFEGFLSRRAGERAARLAELAPDPRTLVLFESPRRVVDTLDDLAAALGDRPAAVCRELTKVHEEVVRGSLSSVAHELRSRDEIRGEVVVVVGGSTGELREAPGPVELAEEAAALVDTGVRRREAAGRVARRHGVATNEVYRALLARDRSPS